MTDIDKEVAAIVGRLKALREGKGLSQLDVALAAGVSQTAVSQIETGLKTPTLATFLKLCKALDVSPSLVISVALEDDDKRKADRKAALEIISKWL